MQLDVAHEGGRRGGGAALLRGRLEVVFVGFALELGQHFVDTPTVAIEIGENDDALRAAEIAASSGELRFRLVEDAPEAGDPRGLAMFQVVDFLGGRTTIEVGLDQTIELARCQDGPVGVDNGSLLRQTKLRASEEAFRTRSHAFVTRREQRLTRPPGVGSVLRTGVC